MTSAHPAASGIVGYRFPPEIQQFLDDNHIPLWIYDPSRQPTVRTVRQRFDEANIEKELLEGILQARDLPAAESIQEEPLRVTPIEWLEPLTAARFGPSPKFYSIPTATQMSRLNLYKGGRLFGLDVSSASAVFALLGESGPEAGSAVLDLCCAPGTKLLMLSELCPGSRVAGIDVSRDRLMVCRSLLTKYGAHNVELYHGDGRYVCSRPMERLTVAKRKSRGRKRQRRGSPEDPPPSSTTLEAESWDLVLCDAECTHDGSVKHMLKHLEASSRDSSGVVGFWQQQSERSHPMPWLDNLDELESLQRALITAAFDALKPGGCMVYSTCSMARRQDENIVEYLLVHKDAAALCPLPFELAKMPCRATMMDNTGAACACRFDPADADVARVDAGGLFIARIRKAL
ncbi:ribosomal RNA small subunit methyltransferase B, putative [Perkinsus marinus ATCC 50983]|uniref:Ribosomal RNA small subunit methyltransferase B, putative n=1 Tax=Perkinsus marinus (strain ATCC 50983 / TXsc) TaxID=423536 RepID=C5LGZ8_PERM5|nr:ribosomal RNA small subunit methyltransferase B, putative [Perkinsus marinus ATCC 50983]EER03969.1 ribosomal RNA small subunit methyltransferase B, putative [Perkinsus marinus ATCC 50983]|eukprot:XP_002772153.1 ribosomal RNA small subunit methyltransferase B, putative [Perkinsus marinus ATCC 50983]